MKNHVQTLVRRKTVQDLIYLGSTVQSNRECGKGEEAFARKLEKVKKGFSCDVT